MERVVKGLAGYSREKENKPASHIIFTIEEYEQLLVDREETKKQTKETINQANRKIEECVKNANLKIKEMQEEVKEKIKIANTDLQNANVEIERLNNLNSNLIRITKERANAKRELKPKKQHNGYIIIDSMQYMYNFKFKNRGKIYNIQKPCWKLHIQSFYDCSIPFMTVKNELQKTFLDFLEELKIKNWNVWELDEEKLSKLWNSGNNFVFDIKYKQNFKSTYWEIECFIRASLFY